MSVAHSLKKFLWHTTPLPTSVRGWISRQYLYPNLPYARRQTRPAPGPPTFVGFFHSGLGIGAAARYQVSALRRAGIYPALVDVSQLMGIKDLEDDQFASVLPPQSGPVIVHANAPETGLILKSLPRNLVAERPLIGCWAWELDKPPQDWLRAYRYLTELWTPSEFVAKAFRDSCPVPIRIVPLPVTLPLAGGLTRRELELPADACLFLCMADGRSDLIRKNIAGCIKAFLLAHAGNPGACLVIKLHHVDPEGAAFKQLKQLSHGAANVLIRCDFLSRLAMSDLLRACDVFVSLHRAEGFGLPLAEAMLLGKPVVATSYSGNLTFMAPHVARLIDYQLVPVEAVNKTYASVPQALWAEPNLQQAAQAMLELFEQPELRVTLGKAGQAYAADALAVDHLATALNRWIV